MPKPSPWGNAKNTPEEWFGGYYRRLERFSSELEATIANFLQGIPEEHLKGYFGDVRLIDRITDYLDVIS